MRVSTLGGALRCWQRSPADLCVGSQVMIVPSIAVNVLFIILILFLFGGAFFMLLNLLVGLPVILLCLLLQSLISMGSLRFYLARLDRGRAFMNVSLPLFGVIVILMLGNFLQLTLWGLLFWLLGEFDSLNVAIYHSAVNFATLGYGDMVMSAQWRLLGPLEAMNGALMIGLSGACMLAVLQHQLKQQFGDRL